MRATSVQAQIKVAPRVPTYKALVFNLILVRGEHGATDQEIQEVLMMSGDTVRPTRGKLLKDGLIYDSGKTRKNRNGNDCIVWVASTISQTGLF
jgi:hypothetical protein